MIIFITVLIGYLSAGFGFALASWLQGAEQQVDAGEAPDRLFQGKITIFILMWPLIALYCYRTEVTRTINKIDFSKLGDK